MIPLEKLIEEKKAVIGVIGLGYVGLPLLSTFFRKNFKVIGFDVDPYKIECLNTGKAYINHIDHKIYSDLANSDENAIFTSKFDKISLCDVIILCVPTPLGKHRNPDLSYVTGSLNSIIYHIRKNSLLVLESTTYPGTMEELVVPILERERKDLFVGEDFFLGYSPEREDPGNKFFTTSNIPKVVGGLSNKCLKICEILYGKVVDQVVTVSSLKTAEAVKITENVFRSVNIALVNELKIIYDRMGIDVNEVLDAADTKPFGFMKFTPGPGLGGHCIPIDPFYLTWKAKEYDLTTRFIELAGEINTKMPSFVINKTIDALNKVNLSLSASKILVIGLSYKPNIDDIRESPTFAIFDLLKKSGCKFDYHDNFVPEIPDTREHSEYKGLKSVDLSIKNLKRYDAVIISTNHDYIDYYKLLEESRIIIDSRNSFSKLHSNDKIIKA